MRDKPLVIYDGRCSFCRIWIEYWNALTGDRVDYARSQDVATQFADVPAERFRQSVQLAMPDGEVIGGARAVFLTLAHAPRLVWPLWLYEHVPGFAPVSEACYRLMASHRDIFYNVTRLTFGSRVSPWSHARVEWIFLRLLAAIYFIAFASFGLQITGLIGARGILPAGRYLDAVAQTYGAQGYWTMPTIFWIAHGDAFLRGVCVAGALISLVLLAGRLERASLACLFVLYLSLCTAGQDFMSFQWDMLLLETGFLALFLGSSKLVILLFRWLLFRLMFLSGAVKLLSHDPNWRNLNALNFHYWTQPLPTPIAWYMSQLPAGVQRFSTAMTLAIELGVPFLIFAPRLLRRFAAFALLFLQVLIFLTGNYTFFNLLAIALCLFLFDDDALDWLHLPSRKVHVRSGIARAVAIVIVVLSLFELSGMFFEYMPWPGNTLVGLAAPFGIVNTYGLFAVMTTTRPEIVVQGSNDGVTWLDYEFPYKAGDLKKRPRWVAPYQPRLDWQMWFAALERMRSPPWFDNFMVRLLQGSPDVLGLLAKNPFPNAPPKYVRALLFDYSFTDFEMRRASGDWWQRRQVGRYFPEISLEDVRLK